MKYSLTPLSGLGNIVLELIGFYHLLKKSGADPPGEVEILDWRDNIRETNMYYGGHPRHKFRHLGMIFPSINYRFVQKSVRDEDVSLTLHFAQDDYHGSDLKRVLESSRDKNTNYTVVLGWFFHPGYRVSYRDEIVNWLQFGPEVREEVRDFFNHVGINPENTVSFHSRLGSPGDGFGTVKIIPEDCVKGLRYLRCLYPRLDTVLVCSESKENFERYFSPEIFDRLGMRYVFYDSDSENCLYAMKECAHHLVGNSTLSYSVIYLDEKFPHKSLAIGTHFEYIRSDFVDPNFISKDGRTGLLHFKDMGSAPSVLGSAPSVLGSAPSVLESTRMKYSMIPVCGMGNVVISLIGFYHTMKEAGLNPHTDSVFFEWQDKPYEEGVVFGGHPRLNHKTLGDIFPKIGYKSVQKSLKDPDTNLITALCNDNYMGDRLNQIVKMTHRPGTNYNVIWSWFSHHLYREKYREEILQWLEFGGGIQREVREFFETNEVNPETTISLHCRLGSPVDFTHLEKVNPDDYLRALQYIKKTYPHLDTVLICSESRPRFENYVSRESIESLGLRYVFYDADPENCIYAMKECAHHIISNSTMSFIIMYLDPKFPHNTLTVGTYQDYTHVQMVTPDMISKDGYTGLLHFKDL